MLKVSKEPNGSFFITDKLRQIEEQRVISGLHKIIPHELRSLSEMSPFITHWLNSIESSLDKINEAAATSDQPLMVMAIETLQRCIPPELKESHEHLLNMHSTANWEIAFEVSINELVEWGKELRGIINKELHKSLFLCLSEVEKDFYERQKQFGEHVPVKFDQIIGDIEEAYKSFAVQRYTACVFHCMRMLEFGVHKLADHFGVPLQVDVKDKTGNPTGAKKDQEWSALCDQILSKIKNLPATTEAERNTKLRFQEIAVHLSNVREERNHVMHARYGTTKRYDKKPYKAMSVLQETKDFMEELALLLP